MNDEISKDWVIDPTTYITQEHENLAKLASSQYAEMGRGLVLARAETRGLMVYYVGPDQFHGGLRSLILSYDPHREFLLSIANPDGSLITRTLPLERLLAYQDPVPASDSNAEPIFNLFVFVSNGVIRQVGAIRHRMSGTDEAKIAFLQSQVLSDFNRAPTYDLPRGFLVADTGGRLVPGLTYDDFLERAPNDHLYVFHFAFEALKAPKNPLYCITPVVHGIPKIDAVMQLNDNSREEIVE